MAITMPTLMMNSTTTDEIDQFDNGKGDNDEGNTEMDGNDVNDDDAYTYDDDYHCYYNDESYSFRYQIMRNCWREEPDDRPSFEQLRHELKRMANQHKVIYIGMSFFLLSICPVMFSRTLSFTSSFTLLSSFVHRNSST